MVAHEPRLLKPPARTGDKGRGEAALTGLPGSNRTTKGVAKPRQQISMRTQNSHWLSEF